MVSSEQEKAGPSQRTEHIPQGRIVLRLDKIIAERRMTLKELAARVGITPVNLSKIKNNRVSAIRFTTLAGICRELHCQPGDILEYRPAEHGDESIR